MSELNVSFDPASLSEIARYAGFATILTPEVQAALEQGARLIVAISQANQHWQHPTGRLESSMRVMSESQMELVVGSDLPYAARREFGFQGVDALGRHYNDQGAFFLTRALDENNQAVLQLIDQAVEAALERMVGG